MIESSKYYELEPYIFSAWAPSVITRFFVKYIFNYRRAKGYVTILLVSKMNNDIMSRGMQGRQLWKVQTGKQ